MMMPCKSIGCQKCMAVGEEWQWTTDEVAGFALMASMQTLILLHILWNMMNYQNYQNYINNFVCQAVMRCAVRLRMQPWIYMPFINLLGVCQNSLIWCGSVFVHEESNAHDRWMWMRACRDKGIKCETNSSSIFNYTKWDKSEHKLHLDWRRDNEKRLFSKQFWEFHMSYFKTYRISNRYSIFYD